MESVTVEEKSIVEVFNGNAVPGKKGDIGGQYVHSQVAAATTWNVGHNLGFTPGGILVLDSLGNHHTGQAQRVDDNNLNLLFNLAIDGTAYLS